MTNCERAKARYHKRKDAKICVQCGQRDERTSSGSPLCERCHKYHTKKNKEYRANNREWVNLRSCICEKKKYKARRENRQCVKCGGKLPDGYYYVHCQKCRDFMKEYRKRKRLENVR